jgi:hypothetical protein
MVTQNTGTDGPPYLKVLNLQIQSMVDKKYWKNCICTEHAQIFVLS